MQSSVRQLRLYLSTFILFSLLKQCCESHWFGLWEFVLRRYETEWIWSAEQDAADEARSIVWHVGREQAEASSCGCDWSQRLHPGVSLPSSRLHAEHIDDAEHASRWSAAYTGLWHSAYLRTNFGNRAGRSGLVVARFSCCARGPRFESRCGQKFAFSQKSLRYAALGTVCTLTAVPRSTQPSTLRETVNEYQPNGIVIIHGDGRIFGL